MPAVNANTKVYENSTNVIIYGQDHVHQNDEKLGLIYLMHTHCVIGKVKVCAWFTGHILLEFSREFVKRKASHLKFASMRFWNNEIWYDNLI